MNINLEYYKIFYYVGGLGSITLAAEELSISQPAVSQAIKLLENTVKTTLFVRTSKGVRFTPEGEMLYSYIQKGYDTILLGERKLLEMINVEAGEIRIGASDMTLQFYLLPYLEKFYEDHPKIKVTVTNAPTPETLKFLSEGKIDFGIVSSPFPNRQGLDIKSVREIEDIFIAGSKYKHLKNNIISYSQLTSFPTICLEKNTSTRRFVDEFLHKKGVVLNPEFELATSHIIVQFALRNVGIACVVKDFAKNELDLGKVFELKFKDSIPTRNICIVKDKKTPMSAAAKKLLNYMNIP